MDNLKARRIRLYNTTYTRYVRLAVGKRINAGCTEVLTTNDLIVANVVAKKHVFAVLGEHCARCAGTGAFITYVENGTPKGPGGICYRCNGKGYQMPADARRNYGADMNRKVYY